MEKSKKRRWLVFLCCLFALTVFAALLLSGVFNPARQTDAARPTPEPYVPGEYPEDVDFAEISAAEETDAGEYYDSYADENDPAHPVLDVKVALYISNLGSRPGEPRPQDIEEEYPNSTPRPSETPFSTPVPTASPSATLIPGVLQPGLQPGGSLPDVKLSDLYITNPDVPNPSFTGEKYLLSWEYGGGRVVSFNVSISVDGGETFNALASGLDETSYELTFPSMPSQRCLLRVSAILDGRIYLTADTIAFALAEAPEPTSTPIANYVDEQVAYTNAPGMRISSALNETVWFRAESSAVEAERLIWQLSKTPFWGTAESYGAEASIIASGEVDPAQGGEFSVDLNSIVNNLTATEGRSGSEEPFLAPQSVYALYMRVVALDENGNCIGDPGRGISFSYGVPDVLADQNSASFADDSKVAVLVQTPYYDKWQWKRVSPGVLNRDLGSTPDRLLFSGLDGSQEGSEIIKNAVQVELQVATSPFANTGTTGFIQPDGLVYSYLDTAPDIGESLDGYNYTTPYCHGLEYAQFVPPKAELDETGGIYYYVRAVFYVPDGENPSILRPMPSETMTVAFRVTSASQNKVEKVAVRSNIPFVQFLDYQPVKWQAPDYDEYFEVTRHIEAEEMNFSIRNSETGDFLLPYALHCATYHWTREQYQAKLDEMLPVGASFHYLKSEPGFWDEFFSLLKAIYSAVQTAYADAKTAAVSLVDYVPLIGDDAKGYLKTAVRYTIDYGLASIGLPPSLPNLDRLAANGLDYCIKAAVDEALRQAGVPADSEAAKEITEQVRKQIAEGMSEEMENALTAMQQNPLHADFLRLSTEKLYEPAYVDVLVANYSDTQSSVAGTLGLSFGEHMEIYRPAVLAVPSLEPGESTVIRVYLDHERNKYDGYGQYFDEIYNGTSGEPFSMRIYTVFSLPDVKQEAEDQGLSPAPLPAVTEFAYDHGNYEYERVFVPADPITEKDTSVDPLDFTG